MVLIILLKVYFECVKENIKIKHVSDINQSMLVKYMQERMDPGRG